MILMMTLTVELTIVTELYSRIRVRVNSFLKMSRVHKTLILGWVRHQLRSSTLNRVL